MYFLHWVAQNCTQFHTKAKHSGITFSHQIAMLCLMHPKLLFTFLAARTHCWLMLSLLLTSTPTSLTAGLLSHHLFPSLCLCPALLHSNCSTSTCPCWISCRIWSLYQSISHWKVSHLIPSFRKSTAPFSLVFVSKFGYIPLLHPDHWQKILNQTGPRIEPWGTLLVRLATSQR